MQVKNYLLTLLMIPLFNGCFSWFTPEVVVKTEYIEKNIPIVPHPDPVKLTNVKLYVVTEENYEEFKQTFIDKNGDFVYIAISVKDYENLSLNIADIRRYLNQQQEIIYYYEDAVQPVGVDEDEL